jgi:hypothetical protein
MFTPTAIQIGVYQATVNQGLTVFNTETMESFKEIIPQILDHVVNTFWYHDQKMIFYGIINPYRGLWKHVFHGVQSTLSLLWILASDMYADHVKRRKIW